MSRLTWFILRFTILFCSVTSIHAATDCAIQTQIPKLECESLLALYQSTNGPSWQAKDGWNENDTPCEWKGVTCSDGQVTQLILFYNQLSGSLPPEIGNFSNLQSLALSNNQLSGSLPPELGKLLSLQSLFLSSNLLTGNIPPQLGYLSNLQTLYLYDNQLSGSLPPTLGDLTKLQSLLLSVNQFSGSIPAELGNLPNLQSLELYSNQLSGEVPKELGSLSSLKMLYVAYNQLSGSLPAELGNLSNLQYLNLSNNQLSGNLPPQLGYLFNLETLELSNNKFNGDLPKELGNLSRLKMLSLYSNQLTGNFPAQLGNLSQLQTLNLYNNQMSGDIPAHLGSLSLLQSLNLSTNQLTGSLPSQLGELSNLLFLYLDNNQLSGGIPSALSKLIKLQYLSLYNNLLGGSLPSELGNLINLQSLNLSNNNLNGPLPKELGNLSNLKELLLFDNHLNGKIPLELAKLTKLNSLSLYNNQLSESIPSELGKLSNLKYLYLASNQLSGDIPETFPNFLNLNKLTLDYNMLTASQQVDNFVSQKQKNWKNTQTIPPSGVSATALSEYEIKIQWTPILYQSDGGYYEVGYSTVPGGPYTFQRVSGNKSASSYTVANLSPGITYYFLVRTHTPAHNINQSALTSHASIEVDATTFRPVMNLLTVNVIGEGNVASTPTGIQCGLDCNEAYLAGTLVTLTATPPDGTSFTGWGGACTGNNPTTMVTMDAAKQCTANFTSLYLLNVSVAGSGSVSSSPTGIQCGNDCRESYANGTLVTLTATPEVGKTFSGWGGSCTGNISSVTLTMDAAKQCTANFTSLYPLNVSVVGAGSVSSSPAGIQCGNDCSESYANGTLVTLTATPEAGKTFSAWGGACTGNTPNITVTMDTAKQCTANFTSLYLLDVSVTGPGNVSSSPVGIQCGNDCSEPYSNGTLVTLTATPEAGKTFSAWGGACTGNTLNVTVTMDAAKQCTANFTSLYPLNVSVAGPGSVNSSPAGIQCGNDCSESYANGTLVTLTATPEAGKTFSAWGGACTGNTPNVTVTMDAAKQCTANFTSLYPLNVSVAGSGSVSSSPAGIQCGNDCSEPYANGTLVTLTATPEAGKTFSVWGGACTGNTPSVTLTMDAAKQCTANFTSLYLLNVSVTGPGSVSSSPAGIQCGNDCSESYANGTLVTLTATPEAGKTFSAWSGACTGNTPNITVTMETAKQCTANFTSLYLLDVSVTGPGNVSSSPVGIQCGNDCSEPYANGTLVTLTATPEAGKIFSAWGGACTGNTPSVTLTMDAAKQCTANFTSLYLLNVSVTGPGSVSSSPVGIQCGSDCSEAYSHGTVVTLTATPEVGQTFSGWGGACTGNNSSVTLTMDAAKQCTANFTSLYLLNVSVAGSGSVSSSPVGIQCGNDCSETYSNGTVVILTATSRAGQTFSGWSGACTGNTPNATITMNTAKQCTAHFTSLYLLNVSVTGPGSVSSSIAGIQCGNDCSEPYLNGVLITLTATPETGKTFLGWSGACAGNTPSITVTMDAAKQCTAHFTSLYLLNVSVTGSGSVSSNPAGIQCGNECSETYSDGTVVTLTALPTTDQIFMGWEGDCLGKEPHFSITLNATKNCTAQFISSRSHMINIELIGKGRVTSHPLGIECGTDCNETYPSSTLITLLATPAGGYLFSGWVGDCQGTTAETSIQVEGIKDCTAKFTPLVCPPAVYSPSQRQLDIPVLAVEIYFPLTDVPNGEYALCERQGNTPLALRYLVKEDKFIFLPQQEIQCASHSIPDKACYPTYSAQQQILELPVVQVTSSTHFPGGRQFKNGSCYKTSLMQATPNPPQGMINPTVVTNPRSFILMNAEEIACE